MSQKIYRCKIWCASWVHFRADDIKEATSLTSRYLLHFPPTAEIKIETPEEVEEGDIPEEDIFDARHLPTITLN